MPSPFPGMDPYLEDAALWSGFHHAFLSALQEQLTPRLRPRYFARVEERVWVVTEDDPAYRNFVPDVRVIEAQSAARHRPANVSGAVITEPVPVAEMIDPEVHEHRIEVRDREDRSVVAVIELLSPSNKTARSLGRESFLQKRREVYATDAHWIEIDLLREGVRTSNHAPAADSEYYAFLSRGDPPRRGFVWPIHLREALPTIAVPLRGGDADVPLSLQEAFNHAYEVNAYDLDLDYRKDMAALSDERSAWVNQLLLEKGLRPPDRNG